MDHPSALGRLFCTLWETQITLLAPEATSAGSKYTLHLTAQIEDFSMGIHCKHIFSKLDLERTYFQIPIAAADLPIIYNAIWVVRILSNVFWFLECITDLPSIHWFCFQRSTLRLRLLGRFAHRIKRRFSKRVAPDDSLDETLRARNKSQPWKMRSWSARNRLPRLQGNITKRVTTG